MSETEGRSGVGPRTGDQMIDRHLPTPGSFADHIYAVAMGPSRDEGDMAVMSQVAADVLAMPEMQALRTYLAVEFYHKRPGASAQMMRDEFLPESVIDWMLS